MQFCFLEGADKGLTCGLFWTMLPGVNAGVISVEALAPYLAFVVFSLSHQFPSQQGVSGPVRSGCANFGPVRSGPVCCGATRLPCLSLV